VIELVNKQIAELEKAGKPYVLEGYPRTRTQALDLQRQGIIPDKFILLHLEDAKIAAQLRLRLQTGPNESEPSPPPPAEVESLVQRALLEYNM
jgi:hypothetical protein